jgi:hypothetical protein
MSGSVERIMLLKLASGVSRDDIARLSRHVLSALPALSELSVGLPSDGPSEKSWDVSLIMRFPSQAALDAALAGSVFQHYLDVELAGKCQVTKAWSFERLDP